MPNILLPTSRYCPSGGISCNLYHFMWGRTSLAFVEKHVEGCEMTETTKHRKDLNDLIQVSKSLRNAQLVWNNRKWTQILHLCLISDHSVINCNWIGVSRSRGLSFEQIDWDPWTYKILRLTTGDICVFLQKQAAGKNWSPSWNDVFQSIDYSPPTLNCNIFDNAITIDTSSPVFIVVQCLRSGWVCTNSCSPNMNPTESHAKNAFTNRHDFCTPRSCKHT